MNKAQFVKELSKKSKLTQKECHNCLNALTAVVTQTLRKGESITLIGFGKFQVKYRSARKSYNPQTRKQVILPANKVPQFKPGKTFKEAISI